jgi:glycine amidinotransferase
VIVGVLDGAAVPSWHIALAATMPEDQWRLYQSRGGSRFDPELVARGNQELDALAHILAAEGVNVRRPARIDHATPFATPSWRSEGGLYAAMPRDLLLVVGDEILEAPMAWRCRYFEIAAYRELLKEYFHAGARWSSAPRPELKDELYDPDYVESDDADAPRYVINELEPTFDAADFIRCGRDIFVQQSQVTNLFGIRWLERHLGPDYRIHVLPFRDAAPMHIDATLMPLAPGKLLVNPERVPTIPPMFSRWDVLRSPRSTIPDTHPMFMSSRWVNMNVLMIDERRVVVERQEEPLIRALEGFGFTCIRCDFRHVMSFGGAFHCVTCDVRRRGTRESYF